MKRLCPILRCSRSWPCPLSARRRRSSRSRSCLPPRRSRPVRPRPFTLELTVKSPYHINADQPLEDFLIGTTVDFKAPAGVVYKKIAFPPSEVRKLDLSPNPMAIYEGVVKVTAEVALAPDFKAAEFVIEGSVGYQACDASMCLPPAEAKFSRKVAVAGGGVAAPVAPANEIAPVRKDEAPPAAGLTPVPAEDDPLRKQREADLAAAAKSGSPKSEADGKPAASPFEDKGLLLTFLLVFLGGLALNLTPCIYPLIPITISYFGGQAEGKKGGAVAHAVIYVLGMAVTYSVLGVIAAFTGSLFGVALQYRPVLIGIALIMVVLALSMFDVYELRDARLPQQIRRRLAEGLFRDVFHGPDRRHHRRALHRTVRPRPADLRRQPGQRLSRLLAVLRPGPRAGRAVPLPRAFSPGASTRSPGPGPGWSGSGRSSASSSWAWPSIS